MGKITKRQLSEQFEKAITEKKKKVKELVEIKEKGLIEEISMKEFEIRKINKKIEELEKVYKERGFKGRIFSGNYKRYYERENKKEKERKDLENLKIFKRR